MALNKSKGNMYSFITHTYNPIKGACSHDCSYCYMKRWGQLKPVRFDEKELKTDLGVNNFIFVGSSCDMFAKDIPREWIGDTLHYLNKFDNQYLFQTKDPANMLRCMERYYFPNRFTVCTTIETNRWYPDIMKNSPTPQDRALAMQQITGGIETFVTIEPLLDFDLDEMVALIKMCNPVQVNLGSDSGNHNLPEPSKEKVMALISELEKFTVIHNKTNLKRLL